MDVESRLNFVLLFAHFHKNIQLHSETGRVSSGTIIKPYNFLCVFAKRIHLLEITPYWKWNSYNIDLYLLFPWQMVVWKCFFMILVGKFCIGFSSFHYSIAPIITISIKWKYLYYLVNNKKHFAFDSVIISFCLYHFIGFISKYIFVIHNA